MRVLVLPLLVCACFSEPPIDEGDEVNGDGAEDSGSDEVSGASSSSEPGCEKNVDCALDEVCSSADRSCISAYGHQYEVRVTLQSSGCFDPEPDCLPDLYFVASEIDLLQVVSELHRSEVDDNESIPAWDTFAAIVDSERAFSLSFYDWDANELEEDELLFSACFDEVDGVCSVPSEETLRAGKRVWDSPGGEFHVEVELVAH